jgi:hypothetical protein
MVVLWDLALCSLVDIAVVLEELTTTIQYLYRTTSQTTTIFILTP